MWSVLTRTDDAEPREPEPRVCPIDGCAPHAVERRGDETLRDADIPGAQPPPVPPRARLGDRLHVVVERGAHLAEGAVDEPLRLERAEPLLDGPAPPRAPAPGP